ncbi:MAG: exonuclease SbcCD subunit D [Candidatus Nanopelagicales bacterium]
MRLLHTSDWHLGRALHGLSLIDAQRDAVDLVVREAIVRKVDLLIIAGDVFDRAVPPIEALRILNEAVTRLNEAAIPVVVIAGNHDSGERLSTYSSVLRDGVWVVGDTDSLANPIVFDDEHGEVLVYALPFLDPDLMRHALGADEPLERSHDAVMSRALELIAEDRSARGNPRSVAIGHAFVVGREAPDVSESERDLSIGGVQAVPVSRFTGSFDYVALGHLHRPQQVGDSEVRYSGSLLRYSFSESGHAKSFLIVDVGAPGTDIEVEQVEIPQPRPMSRLRGSMNDLLSDAHAEARDHFVELIVTEESYPERMHARLDAVYPHALRKEFETTRSTDRGAARGDARGRDPVEVIRDFLDTTGVAVDEDGEIALVRQVYERVREAR